MNPFSAWSVLTYRTSGQQTVASCVVFNRDGPATSDYRRYNIDDITPGDDQAH